MSDPKKDVSELSDVPEAEVRNRKRGFSISIVWLVPLVAVLIGGWLVYKALSEKGPTIEISFKSAEGLEAGKTKIKYKEVELGQVSAIKLSEDLSKVVVTAELVKEAENFLSVNTRFWVVRARVGVSGVSGLGTLFSGAYITLDPGKPGNKTHYFKGLEQPPLVTTDLPGRHFILEADSRGSLDVGSPVYYRKIQVGQIVKYDLAEDGHTINFKIFVNAPYHEFVYRNTRFWNASGIDFKLDTQGVRVDSESLVSILIGGIAFGIPQADVPDTPAEEEAVFRLFHNVDAAKERTYWVRTKAILYFDESVRGLDIGAPVEFYGIQMGQVIDVKLVYDQENTNFRIRVLVEIESERWMEAGFIGGDTERQELVASLLEKGFRAQLKTGNLLTGKQVVVLDFFPNAPPATLASEEGLPVFPTVPTPMEEISTKFMRILEKIDAIPLDQIGKDLGETIKSAKQLTESPEILEAIKNLNATLEETRLLVSDLRTNVTPEISAVLEEARQSLANAERMLNADSPLQVRMNSAIVEITAAARSLRLLMDYLGRHPESLLRGKGPTE
ncbi:MAG: MCE family protein [Deltaproteobacteria bacterium]|jgi:paraquat-inducible protein B|nr:MCE family protein [Deltaproteobacteria bacterium]